METLANFSRLTLLCLDNNKLSAYYTASLPLHSVLALSGLHCYTLYAKLIIVPTGFICYHFIAQT